MMPKDWLGLARQFQGVPRDVEELKMGKESATIEQRVGDNLGGVFSPHHQSAYDNAPPYGYYDMPAQSSYLFHESGYQGWQATKGGRKRGLGRRGDNRTQEKIPRNEAWHEDNLFYDYGENPNVGKKFFEEQKMHKMSLKDDQQRSKRSFKITRLYEDKVIKLKTLKTRIVRDSFISLARGMPDGLNNNNDGFEDGDKPPELNHDSCHKQRATNGASWRIKRTREAENKSYHRR
ncbi:hypothetical protein M9H77_07190 [Catharanthus roseus]|uniref:Uncharacterized protein n=1 Tax=Catharanthus roseus TaxID=4058 RepID=A0ACC0BU96_CATRO|nr:hypothetical protein M9H77_07190 [Catharanthus roseus]